MIQPPTSEFFEATITELQTALADGRVTARDLVQWYLARIEAYDRHGPVLNAISAVNENALADADFRDAERHAGRALGPLHGIPVIVKDNYETRDMQTAAGSILMQGWIPPTDAFTVARLREAGAIIIAKSNMHEWAWSWETFGSLFGQTRNPYALDRVPGGSSGGTGVAIAANFAAVGLGSDTCGSILVPAAHNALVGLRPTQGLVSQAGIVPLAHTQDTGGPMGRCVADVALVLDAIAGYDSADQGTAESLGRVPSSYTAFLQVDGLRGARLGIVADLLVCDPEDEEVARVIQRAVAEMRAQGAEVIELHIPELPDLLATTFSCVIFDEFRHDLDHYLAGRATVPVHNLAEIVASGQFHPGVERVLCTALSVDMDTKDYYEKLAHRAVVRRTALAAMADHKLDALVYPTVRRKAIAIGKGEQVGVNCHLSAHSGLPAITVPAGFTEDGLPVGLELLGKSWGEDMLLRLAYGFEQATHYRRPPAYAPRNWR